MRTEVRGWKAGDGKPRTEVLRLRRGLWWLILTLVLAGCAVNPVTGRQELALVSESQEISIGRDQYLPARQLQGGGYTVDPGVTAYVRGVGQRLARVSDRQLPYEFAVLNSSVPNAWSLPGGKIAINRGLLLELQDEAELAAVLAHEIVHAAARHGAKGLERSLLLQGAVLAAGIAAQGHDYANALVGGAQVAAGLVNSRYGREAELEADYYGMLYMSRAGYDPMAAVRLQETFVRLSREKHTTWLDGLFASHPPSEERVAANRATARGLPNGGILGRKRFQTRIARLIRSRDAYVAYDDGEKALRKGELGQALVLVDKALAIEPREGLFHALRGDIRFKQKRFQDAITNYDRAVARNDNFYYYYLQRGLTRFKLNHTQQAEVDLEKSVRLLPTARAYNAMGKIQLARGNRQKAKQYFRAAAGSNTGPGRQARQALVRLDLPDNPGRYLRHRLLVNGRGELVVEVGNPAPVAVSSVILLVRLPDGRVLQRLTGYIPAGGSIMVGTGAHPAAGQGVSVRIVGAAVVP